MEIRIVGSGPYEGQEITREITATHAGIVTVFHIEDATDAYGNSFERNVETQYCAWTGWLSSRDSGGGSDVYWRIPPSEMRRIRDEYPDGCKDPRITWNYPDRDDL